MNRYTIPNTDLVVSRIAYGCMMLSGFNRNPITAEDRKKAVDVVLTAYEAGINLFDHADIYGYGKSETLFSGVWQHIPRDRIVLQSKCGIILPNDPRYDDSPYPDLGRYDFSYAHIIRSVEGILERLQTSYLDLLLLHRPDPLVEPEEVARAFDELQQSGKVRYFGVSNHNAMQIELLKKTVDQPLVVNQLELSLLHAHLINEGVIVNQDAGPHALASSILDYCRLHNILVQAWSPIAGGTLFQPPGDALPAVREAAQLLARLAEEKGTTREAIALAWLLRHPAGIQPIIGTTRPERVEASVLADDVTLSREEWYALFVAARGRSMP